LTNSIFVLSLWNKSIKSNTMKFITAKFKSKCAETGKPIAKGENCLYDNVNKKVYSVSSSKYLQEQETANISSFIEAQENAYFDNFCQTNNI